MVAKSEIVTALEARYDYYSARNVFRDAARESGLGDKDKFSPAEVATFAEALKSVGDRLDSVLSVLEGLSGGAKPAPKAKAEPAPAKEEEPAAEEAPAEEAPAEEAPAEEAPAEEAAAEEAPAEEEAEEPKKDEKPAKKKAASKKSGGKKKSSKKK